MLFEFVKGMHPETNQDSHVDFASYLGPLFFTWVVLQLFPVSLWPFVTGIITVWLVHKVFIFLQMLLEFAPIKPHYQL